VIEKMARENPDVIFAECDVDEADDVAAQCGIKAMPTFHFYKNGNKIDEVMGADQAKIKDLVAQLK
jgi:thioredoxin 1